MPWMAGLLIEIILRKPLLTLLCSGALQGSSACLHYELSWEAPGTMAAELAAKSPSSLHIPVECCFCSAIPAQ